MKQCWPAPERNREPISAVLKSLLPSKGWVLETASGTGQHAVAFAERFPDLQWQPSDPDPEHRASIDAWRTESGCANLRPALDLDVTAPWSAFESAPVAILNFNMIHISPWSATVGLLNRAGDALTQGGLLYLYGPFFVEDEQPAPSNLAFDASLRGRNPAWGIRMLADVVAVAIEHGLEHNQTIPMPANNLSVIFERLPRAD